MAAGRLAGQRALIIGHGAIGTVIAAALAESGARIEAASARGSKDGRRQVWRADVLVSEYAYYEIPYHRIDGQHDLVVLSPKTTALVQLAPVVSRAVGLRTTLVSAMNGLPWWFARSTSAGAASELVRLPRAQIVGCVINLAATRLGDDRNQVLLSGPSSLTLGAASGCQDDIVNGLVAALSRDWLNAQRTADIRVELWHKLLNNASVNPVSALCMATCGEVTSDAGARELIRQAMLEVLAVGRACGLALDEDVEKRIAWSAAFGDFKTSMLQDLEKRNELEVDALLSSVVRLARVAGVNAPTLETVAALVRLRDELNRKNSQHAIAVHP